MISAIQILKDVNASTKVLSLSSDSDWLEASIKDMQVMKPEFDGRLFLRVHLYSDASMQTLLVPQPIDTHDSSKVKYASYLQNSNGQTSWQDATTEGFPVSLAPCPVIVKILSYIKDNDVSLSSEHLYVKYEWYSIADGEEHVSDVFSTVIPSATEAGANAADAVGKREFEALRQEVEPEQKQAEEDDYGLLRCFSSKMNVLGTVSNGTALVLDDYAFSKSYFLKFTASSSEDVKLVFYVDEGNGPERRSEMNINQSFTFPKGGTYIAQVQFDSIVVSKSSYDGKSGSSVKFTDESLSLDDVEANAHIVKATHDKYQWYLNNYTQMQLSNYVFVLSSDVEDVFSKRIVNVADPVNAQDAVTKSYLDQKIGDIGDALDSINGEIA